MIKQIQKIFLFGLISIFSFFLLTSIASASVVSGSINTGLDTGIGTIETENCTAVTHGTMAPDFPICTLTCNSGYRKSGNSCVSNGGSGGGGSSSSSGDTTPPVVVTPTLVPGCSAGNLFNTSTGQPCASTVLAPGCSAGNLFNTITGASCGAGGGSSTTVTTSTTNTTPVVLRYAFGTGVVKLGTQGGACKAWQTFLNAHGASLSTDGACGKLTMAAARLWQASVGLVADGLLGANSRAKANEL